MVSAALPTFDVMQDRVYAVLRDSDQTYVTLTEVKQWLNEGLLDLNARLRLRQATATGTSSSTGVVTLPTEFVEATSLWFDTVPVEFVTDAVFESYYEPAAVTPFAVLARVYNNQIETYPAQASADYTLRYVERPTLLSADADQPEDLTPELAQRVIDYARAEAKMKEGEYTEHEYYRQRYEEGLPGRPRVDKKMFPGSLTLIPQPGPFG